VNATAREQTGQRPSAEDIRMRTRMRRQARIMKAINVPMRRVLSLPFPTPLSRRLMLVTITGRRSGRLYRQPLSYVRDGEVLLTPGGGKWTLNLSEDQPVPVRLRGRRCHARPELVRDRAVVTDLLRVMTTTNPGVSRFIPFIASDGTIDQARLATALRHGFCVVRWHLYSRTA